MLGVALARATDAPGRGFHWGPEAHHPKLPRGRRVKRRPGRLARGDPVRACPGGRRHREPHRCAAQVDGDDRVLRPQGVPARRGRRRAVQRRMTPSGPSTGAGPEGGERPGRGLPVEVFPPTLREVMLRPWWIGMLLLCLVVAGVFAWLGQWQLGRAVQTSPTTAGRDRGGAAHRRRHAAGRVPARTARRAARVGERLLGHRRLPHRRVAVQRRRRGVLGHRSAAADRRSGRPGSDRAVSLAVALGWAPTREKAEAAASRLEDLVASGGDGASAELTGRLIADEDPALPPRGADPQTMTTHVVGGAARAVARRRGPRRVPALPRLG